MFYSELKFNKIGLSFIRTTEDNTLCIVRAKRLTVSIRIKFGKYLSDN